MTRNLVECTFSCLTDILFRTSLWTINNYSLGRRWIEAEYSLWGKYSKSHYSLRLKSILTKSLRKPFKFNLIGKSVTRTCAEPPIKLQLKKPPANKAFWFIWNRQKFKLCFPAWEAKKSLVFICWLAKLVKKVSCKCLQAMVARLLEVCLIEISSFSKELLSFFVISWIWFLKKIRLCWKCWVYKTTSPTRLNCKLNCKHSIEHKTLLKLCISVNSSCAQPPAKIFSLYFTSFS